MVMNLHVTDKMSLSRWILLHGNKSLGFINASNSQISSQLSSYKRIYVRCKVVKGVTVSFMAC